MSKKEMIPKSFIKETNIQKINVIHDGQLLDVTKDYTRTWIDKKEKPYKYEFRGKNFQAYLNPYEVVITR